VEILNDLNELKKIAEKKLTKNDSAHDFEHVMRVYRNAEKICRSEKIDSKLVLTSVLLHDIVSFPKNDKRSKFSSSQSAKFAKKILSKMNFDEDEIRIIYDAIIQHSFSKNQKPKTIVGKILQDADRLDAIGAIGIARAFTTGGFTKRQIYNAKDPFCLKRDPNDNSWTLDHFFKKLLILEKKMYTKYAKKEASKRTKILKKYLSDLKHEI